MGWAKAKVPSARTRLEVPLDAILLSAGQAPRMHIADQTDIFLIVSSESQQTRTPITVQDRQVAEPCMKLLFPVSVKFAFARRAFNFRHGFAGTLKLWDGPADA